MNKRILAPIIAGLVGAAVLSLYFSNDSTSFVPSKMNLSYESSNSKLQSLLATDKISMSNPLKIKGDSIETYCNFFSDQNFQSSIRYCTSTELTDSQGAFVGNIHMVGDAGSPFVVLAVMQTDPFISQIDSVKSVSEAMVESLVCGCWEEKKPGGFESVSEWIDAAKSHHLEAKRITSKSEISGLAQKNLLMEISTNTEGYLWKFIITN